MKVISTKGTIYQFKKGDVVRCSNYVNHFAIQSNKSYKINCFDGEDVLLKRSKSRFTTPIVRLKIDKDNMFGWISNKEWLKERRKTHYYKDGSWFKKPANFYK